MRILKKLGLSLKSTLLIVLIILITAGVIILKLHKPVAVVPVDSPKYVSLESGYLFSIPTKHIVDETALPKVTLVYPESLSIDGKALDELYADSTVAIQPIVALKDNNAKNFKEYISNTLAADLRKNLHAASDVRPAKQGGVDGLKIYAIANDGKHLRAIYALDITQPVMMAARDEIDALKVVGNSIEDLQKTKYKPDIDKASELTNSVLQMLKKQDSKGIEAKGTANFKSSVDQSKLSTQLKSSASSLDKQITMAGGSYDGKSFVVQLRYEPKTSNETATSGTISLLKQGKDWKLDGLVLP